MREHVMKETDTDLDRMISLDEFTKQTKKDEFNKHDESWDPDDDIADDFHFDTGNDLVYAFEMG